MYFIPKFISLFKDQIKFQPHFILSMFYQMNVKDSKNWTFTPLMSYDHSMYFDIAKWLHLNVWYLCIIGQKN